MGECAYGASVVDGFVRTRVIFAGEFSAVRPPPQLASGAAPYEWPDSRGLVGSSDMMSSRVPAVQAWLCAVLPRCFPLPKINILLSIGSMFIFWTMAILHAHLNECTTDQFWPPGTWEWIRKQENHILTFKRWRLTIIYISEALLSSLPPPPLPPSLPSRAASD